MQSKVAGQFLFFAIIKNGEPEGPPFFASRGVSA